MTGMRYVGQRVVRREDPRLVTGHGTYVDDLPARDALHVAFVRSNVARGRIVHLDTAAALEVPGVVAALTAADLNGLVREEWLDYEGPPGPGPRREFRLLADGDVRFVGEPVVMVLAESRYAAEDGAELVDLEVDPQPPVVRMEDAVAPGAPLVHPHRSSNVAGRITPPEDPELDAVFASAAHVVTETFDQHRYTCVPLETRGILASWDPFRAQMQVWVSTQGPHGVRTQLARVLGLGEHQVRVVMPDVGGGFGQKMFLVPEEIGVPLASRLVGRPVKWIEDRRENLMSGQHAREDRVSVSFAVDGEGRILGARADFLENVGAFPAGGASSIGFSSAVFPGPYRIPRYRATARAVYTNTTGRCSYRGPWMVETVAREQMMDRVAAELGMDPLELRRRNVVRGGDLPYTTAAGLTYDQVTAAETLDQAADIAGYDAFRDRQAQLRAEGRLVGIGISLFTEPSGIARGTLSTEAATVRVGFNGKVEVVTSSASHGQSLETTIAQVVADELGVDLDDVMVVQGDTATSPYGPGTGGSRSAVLSSGAARTASRRVRDKIVQIAAHRLEAAPEDLEVSAGRVSVAGTPVAGVTFAELARTAYAAPETLPPGEEAGLEASARYSPSSPFTWSNACHICTCEVDPTTGEVTLDRYVVSEDCGVMINPNVVEGQIAGGVVQGIGGVLYEQMLYDGDGNPLTTTFVDYLLPTTTEVPMIEYGHIETPAPTNEGGHKGLGEGGAIGAPPAVINAVNDALAPCGVRLTAQPLGPAQIIAALETASAPAGERSH
ncbi:MAG TPA: xanthine dehydrogenase family protein molybdopterin-binding subunit [Acidimicrobiales bacterium]|nr:xanthine dehydrogenase family protein molybdopterin-binding subunit [Acidimicrobiales bacterium]